MLWWLVRFCNWHAWTVQLCKSAASVLPQICLQLLDWWNIGANLLLVKHVIKLLLEFLKSLVHDILSLLDLTLARVVAESIQIFDCESDHVWLLSADIFQLSQPLLQVDQAYKWVWFLKVISKAGLLGCERRCLSQMTERALLWIQFPFLVMAVGACSVWVLEAAHRNALDGGSPRLKRHRDSYLVNAIQLQ